MLFLLPRPKTAVYRRTEYVNRAQVVIQMMLKDDLDRRHL